MTESRQRRLIAESVRDATPPGRSHGPCLPAVFALGALVGWGLAWLGAAL